VVVTSARVLVGNKTLTGKAMVRYVLYVGAAPDEETAKLDGGLLSRGYSTVAIEPGIEREDGGRHAYVALTPVEGERSSTNLSRIRIYTELGETFRLPEADAPRG
jgi:hypothetical protein